MVFDAHDRAFAFLKGSCTRGIYDNMKTAVETIFVGKERAYNRRFQQMCSHYLVDPVACTPASVELSRLDLLIEAYGLFDQGRADKRHRENDDRYDGEHQGQGGKIATTSQSPQKSPV